MAEFMVKRVLMIASYFPPMHVSSGQQRTLKFSTYLREHQWQPTVLSVNPRAYMRVNNSQIREIPDDVKVIRAFCLDTAKHLSLFGKYPGFLAWPDRWISWWLGAIPAALWHIRKYRPDVIWTTYPIATANLIGLTLHKITGIPWVADLRDSMTEDDYPPDPQVRKIYRWIEKKLVQNAVRVIFTADGTLEMYKQRYPEIDPNKWHTISNGFDEDNFREATTTIPRKPNKQLTLVHSGLLYPSERDPIPFFNAISDLKKENDKLLGVKVILRASGNEDFYQQIIREMGIDDIISLEPPLAYNEALAEMLNADGLMVFQAKNCNHQIPAKVYEYIRARKHILALTDKSGDTAHVLEKSGLGRIADIADRDNIRKNMLEFVDEIKSMTYEIASDEVINSFSRRAQTKKLAVLLDSVAKV